MVISSGRVQSLEAVFLIFPACLELHVGVLSVVGIELWVVEFGIGCWILLFFLFLVLMYLCVCVCQSVLS